MIKGDLALRDHLDRAVIVAVSIMRVVQVPIYEVADVIAMRDRRVPATRAVDVVGIVTAAVMTLGTFVWVFTIYCDGVLVDMITMRMMKVTVMEIVNMTVMLNGDVATVGAVDVSVVRVDFAIAHITKCCWRDSSTKSLSDSYQ